MLRSAVLRLQGRIALPALDRLAVSSGVHIPITPTSFAQSTILPNSKPVPLSHYRFFSSSRPNSEQDQGTQSQSIGQIEPKLSLTFTCTVQDCGHRSSHEFTKRSYEKGIVLVQVSTCMRRSLDGNLQLLKFGFHLVSGLQQQVRIVTWAIVFTD